MADFCAECSESLLGDDYGDLAGLCPEGGFAQVLCEGCGVVLVNERGRKLSDEAVHAIVTAREICNVKEV